jgi:putative SOS response-associated peptidase YedK
MCGRYNLRHAPAEVAEFLQAQREPGLEFGPRYNIAPTQPIVAARREEDGRRVLTRLRWGLIPSWADDPNSGPQLINARAETVATKPAFRSAFRRRRCLIPASGFYEWRREGGTKQPFHIHRRDEGLFCFAGLWEQWEKGSRDVESAAIITTQANPLLRPIHDRMPVILRPDQFTVWLSTEIDPAALRELLVPYSGDELEADPISDRVNNVRNDSPECLRSIPSDTTLWSSDETDA